MQVPIRSVRKPLAAAGTLALVALAATLILTRLPGPGTASASSHSEAPLISQDPRADNTDLYAFVSPEDTDTVTMIANYIPLEAPASGPNFYSFDDSALYEVKVDNTGDGQADIGYQFRFHTQTVGTRTRSCTRSCPIGLGRTATELEPAADLQRHARPLQQGRQGHRQPDHRQGRPGRPRDEHSDPARQRRAADDAELRRARSARGHGPRERRQGVRGPARRPVLRRPRLDLRPGRASPLQPVPPDPAPGGAGVDALKNYNTHSIEIQVPIAQLTSVNRPTSGSTRRRAGRRRPSSRMTGRGTATARGCRSRGSATRSSTRS